jgi:hypothetical protein
MHALGQAYYLLPILSVFRQRGETVLEPVHPASRNKPLDYHNNKQSDN